MADFCGQLAHEVRHGLMQSGAVCARPLWNSACSRRLRASACQRMPSPCCWAALAVWLRVCVSRAVEWGVGSVFLMLVLVQLLRRCEPTATLQLLVLGVLAILACAAACQEPEGHPRRACLRLLAGQRSPPSQSATRVATRKRHRRLQAIVYSHCCKPPTINCQSATNAL